MLARFALNSVKKRSGSNAIDMKRRTQNVAQEYNGREHPVRYSSRVVDCENSIIARNDALATGYP